MSRTLGFVLSMAVALSASGQALTVGNDVVPTSYLLSAPPRTYVDLAGPATATGTVTAVKLGWSTAAAGCSNVFKIKFFRRAGNTYTMIAERGPFSGPFATGAVHLPLSPAVNVVQGDLIGIAHLANCGAPMVFTTTESEGYHSLPGDVTGSYTPGVTPGVGSAYSRIALYGTGTATEAVEGVIAVAGSTRGAFGANFKTSLHLFNPSDTTMTGRIVYRPASTTSGTFPSMAYTLGPLQIVAYEDVLTAMGQSGLGSIDVVVAAGAEAEPIVTSRVYNDAGASGTAGLTQDLIGCDETLNGMARVLGRGDRGYLFTPLDLTRTRFNIGVRTLDSGAYIRIILRNAAGAPSPTRMKAYNPNWFEQVDAATFVGGSIAGNETIEIYVVRGSVIVYGATTDNVTNDPAVQFAKVSSAP